MSESSALPLHLQPLAPLLDGQQQAVRDAYEYYVCLLLVERQKMRLVDTWRDGRGEYYRFAADDGECYVVPRMVLSRETETAIMANLSRLMGSGD